jgi:hypothetical protein
LPQLGQKFLLPDGAAVAACLEPGPVAGRAIGGGGGVVEVAVAVVVAEGAAAPPPLGDGTDVDGEVRY